MRIFIFPTWCVALLLVSSAIQTSVAHPFHASFAEVEWNAKTGKLEVALQFDPDDLEKAVRLHCGERINIDDERSAPLIAAYVREHFSIGPRRISNDAKVKHSVGNPAAHDAAASDSKKRDVAGSSNRRSDRFEMIGKEIDAKFAWVYFEIVAKDGPEGLEIENALLANASHPSNTVLVRSGKRTTTMTFTRQTTRRTVRFPDAESSTFGS